MIVGGYAVAFHGFPRFTQDIDIFFLNTKENIEHLRRVLITFGFTEKDVPEELFQKKGNIIRFGVAPVRIDMVNEIDGVTFEEAEKNIVRGRYGQVEVSFIGKAELIRNKKATGRSQDKVDAEKLG